MTNSPVNILIVDDAEMNIIALEALLKQKNVKIFSTTSPNEALKICWESDISIALVDVKMPGMNGWELVDMLQGNQRTKDIHIIFVTAISKEEGNQHVKDDRVDYLYKPLDPDIAIDKINSLIEYVIIQRKQDVLR